MKEKITKGYLKALDYATQMKEELRVQRLAFASGELSGEMYMDTLIKVLICIVIGGLLLALFYTLFKDTLFPQFTQKILDLLNFTA